VGMPRSGHINTERLRCKYQYKQAIGDAAVEDDKCWNDSLFNNFCKKKTMTGFGDHGVNAFVPVT